MGKIAGLPIIFFLLIGAGISGYLYIMHLDSTQALAESISQYKTDLDEKLKSLDKTKKSSETLPDLKAQIEQLSKSLEHALDIVPSQLSAVEVIRIISKEAKDSGVRIVQSRPKDANVKNFFTEIPIEVEFEGSYSQLTFFTYLLSKDKIIFHPTDMDLSIKEVVDGQTNLKMSGVVTAFKSKGAP